MEKNFDSKILVLIIVLFDCITSYTYLIFLCIYQVAEIVSRFFVRQQAGLNITRENLNFLFDPEWVFIFRLETASAITVDELMLQALEYI